MGAILTLLTDQEALEFLAAHADEDEAGRSAYWREELENFSVGADGGVAGRAALGNASAKETTFNKLAHAFLQWPLHRLAPFQDRADSIRLGRLIAARQRRQITFDMLRQCFTLALIRKHLDLGSTDEANLVIGDGYGVMASLLLLHAPHRRTICVNLTKPLILDLAYIRQGVPGIRLALVTTGDEMKAALADKGIRLIGVRADDFQAIQEAAIGLAVNIVSMQEMEPSVVEQYFNLLRGNKARQTAFYCCNKLYKKLSDGTELRFDDFPWRDNDSILHNTICPWSQWYYDKIPPCWHYRRGEKRVIWHRLALLEMDPT
ncbi:MAG: putative sugar O-methyltransferase [Proteobacteria bacterium]|nr:putative sugar O-methyltransferase [Pseudomonadota bacterium]